MWLCLSTRMYSFSRSLAKRILSATGRGRLGTFPTRSIRFLRSILSRLIPVFLNPCLVGGVRLRYWLIDLLQFSQASYTDLLGPAVVCQFFMITTNQSMQKPPSRTLPNVIIKCLFSFVQLEEVLCIEYFGSHSRKLVLLSYLAVVSRYCALTSFLAVMLIHRILLLVWSSIFNLWCKIILANTHLYPA